MSLRRKKNVGPPPAAGASPASPPKPPAVPNAGAAASVGHDNIGIVSTGDRATNVQVSLPERSLRPVTEVVSPPRLSNVPARTGEFVGRDDELTKLDVALRSGTDVVVAAVHGLGGVGKSTLASRHAAARVGHFNPIWWITADSVESLQAGLAGLATRLQPELRVLPPEALAQRAMTWLAAHEGWLLILDNVTFPSDVAPLLSLGMSGSVLVTSRLAEGWYQLGATVLRLDVLTEESAIDLLTRIATHDRPEADLDGAAELVRELGYLPLAVEQASAYIHQNRLSPRSYLSLLTEHASVILDRAARGSNSERTVARIWRITLDVLADTPFAGRLLRILAWYAPESIPRTLLDGEGQAPQVQEAIGALAAYNLINLTGETITVHRLVQVVARTPDPIDPHRQADDLVTACDRATALLMQQLPDHLDPERWPSWRSLLPHIDALAANTRVETDSEEATRLFNRTGLFLENQGAISRAILYIERALIACERVCGPDHPGTLSARHNLAGAYKMAGDLERAIPLFEQTLADQERVNGPDHPNTLGSRNNLAHAYLAAGDLERAILLCEQNLATCERVFGPEHPQTLNSRNTLAVSYQAAGDAGRAILLLKQTLADQERVLGSDHHHTLVSRNNLASTYLRTADLECALPLLEQNLVACERVLGPEHPDTLTCRNNLANAHKEAGNLKRAMPLFEQNLAASEQALGMDHPQTMTCRNNMADACHVAGDMGRAILLFEQTLADRERILGTERPDTLESRNNLAGAWQAAGDLKRAICLYEQSLTECERILGVDHRITKVVRDNLNATRKAANE